MDEEIEKPFPIEFIVILILIAIANDIAQVYFLFLDFTGVGIAGEAIMEPIDAALGFFFTGAFVWRVGWGGGTISQYIGSLLQMLPIPTRTISVGIGMWVANHPRSLVGKAAATAASLESGNVGGALSKTEEGIEKMEGATNAEKKLRGGSAEKNNGAAENDLTPEHAEPTPPAGENGEGENKNAAENNIFTNPLENPMGIAEEEEFNPTEDQLREGEGFDHAENTTNAPGEKAA